MTFISTVPESGADGEAAAMYARVRETFGGLPNFAKAFSHRPAVMAAWMTLIESVRGNMDLRRYELVTIAAARELRSSYCMLAHSAVLMREHYDAAELKEIVETPDGPPLDETDRAIMRFAARVVRDAAAITEADVAGLKELGLADAEVFDIAAAAAARCFFSKTLDALGVLPDASFSEMDAGLRNALVVGRPIEGQGDRQAG